MHAYRPRLLNIFAALMIATAAAHAQEPNPFAHPSPLPFQAPPFDRIKDADYLPAFDEGMKQQLAEIDRIVRNPAAPTFENTIVAIETSGRMLDRVNLTFSAVQQANTSDTLDNIQTVEAPKLAAQEDAILLNATLFSRVRAVYYGREKKRIDPESRRLLDVTYQRFVHAGANLSEADKATLRELDEREAALEAAFQQKLVAAAKAGALVTGDKSRLAGLTDEDLAAAEHAAETRGLTNQYLLPLQNTTQQPSLAELSDRATREQLFHDSWTRAERGDTNDTRQAIIEMAQLRARKARLLGYRNYAAYVLYDQMVKSPKAVDKFIGQLVPATAAKAADEARQIQARIDKSGMHFDLQPWDWKRYSEMVRKDRYDLNEDELKPYFVLDKVLQDGVFYAAHELYGITFKERHDLPVYHPDVRVFEVFDADGSELGLIYFDYFKRDNKSGGAWMNNLVQESTVLGTKPVVCNVANFPAPAAGQPALLTFDDVTTMFHEFGHGLNSLFADQQYPSLSGVNTARDWVEFPSQFNEHWALYPAVLKHYAVHYQTGEPISQALIDKLKKSQTWGQGYDLGELLAASELDMQWHELAADTPVRDVDAFERQSLARTRTDFPNVPPRYRSSYFLHIWSNGYAAGYYAYQWTVMLDDDAFAWFTAHGGLTRANGQRFRDLILSRGQTEDYGAMFRKFYGKNPDVGPMLEDRGLNKR